MWRKRLAAESGLQASATPWIAGRHGIRRCQRHSNRRGYAENPGIRARRQRKTAWLVRILEHVLGGRSRGSGAKRHDERQYQQAHLAGVFHRVYVPLLAILNVGSLSSTLANRLRPCKFCVGLDSRVLRLGALKRRGCIACDTHFRTVKNSLEFTLQRFVSQRVPEREYRRRRRVAVGTLRLEKLMYRSHLITSVMAIVFLCCAAHDALGEQAESRLWTDSTSHFQVQATLVEQTDLAVRVRTTDGGEITVPTNRLSQADQDYLKSQAAPQDNPFAGGTPMAEVHKFPLHRRRRHGCRAGDTASAVGIKIVGRGNGLARHGHHSGSGVRAHERSVCSRPAARPFPHWRRRGAGESRWMPTTRSAVPVPVNLAEGRFLVSIGRNMSGSPQETRGRIYAVSLAAQESRPGLGPSPGRGGSGITTRPADGRLSSTSWTSSSGVANW